MAKEKVKVGRRLFNSSKLIEHTFCRVVGKEKPGFSFAVNVRPRGSASWNLPLLRCLGSVTPGHQFVEPGDLVIGDAAEHVGQPSLRIDAIQLGGFDQGIDNGR